MGRRAFTLVELVVVVLILGILAAVAVPRLFQASGNAIDNGIKQTLTVIRNAIEMYAAENGGALPGADGTEATFKSDLAPYLRAIFPSSPVGAANNQVRITSGVSLNGSASPTDGWAYSRVTGEFIVDSNQPSGSDPSVNYDDL